MKAFLRRPGGIDQYPDVTVNWKLHHSPKLHVYDASNREIKTVDLSPLKTPELHGLFAAHFRRANVDPPNFLVRTWRRLFGWAYGISTFEATSLFVCGGVALSLICYLLCFRYTAICDGISDL